MKLRVIFIGGLTNGKIVYDYLAINKHVDLLLAITHTDDYKGPGATAFPDGQNIIKSNTANNYLEEIKKLKPDYIFVAGWSELLESSLYNISSKGTIGFHPSRLPLDRGRSVLAWQIEEGYKKSALSMFYYSDFPDGGDIIAQEKFTIEENDYISDVLNKVDKASESLMRAYFPLIRQGLAPRIKQDLQQGNFRRLRNRNDSIINWDTNTSVIFNKIRAIAPPYPCALTLLNGEWMKVSKAEPLESFQFGTDKAPGSLIATVFDGSVVIKTRDGFIRLTQFEKE